MVRLKVDGLEESRHFTADDRIVKALMNVQNERVSRSVRFDTMQTVFMNEYTPHSARTTSPPIST